jgi:large subunit ribosomal protein L10
LMNGEPLTAEQIAEIARLPARDVLHGQVVAMVASPITGLVRTLNALIAGLAIQLKQIADEGMVPVGGDVAAPAAEAPEEGDPAEAEQAAQAEQADEEAARSAEDQETESSSEESAPAGAEAAGEESEESETPSEGDEKE